MNEYRVQLIYRSPINLPENLVSLEIENRLRDRLITGDTISAEVTECVQTRDNS